MFTAAELIASVDQAFAVTGREFTPWPDPHPDRSPRDEEYSRLSDPAKWRIVGARADAWVVALVGAGLAVVDPSTQVQWRVPPRTVVSRTTRVVPYVSGGLPLIIARSQLGSLGDAGVTVGVGDPAVCVAWIPDCGCDACDSGSQDVLDELDDYFLAVASGAFRWLWSVDRQITVIGDGRWSASGIFRRREVDAILANPDGWQEMCGPPWTPDLGQPRVTVISDP